MHHGKHSRIPVAPQTRRRRDFGDTHDFLPASRRDLEPLESLESSGDDWAAWLEDEILLEELTSHMDAKARRMFVLRVFGYLWNEIGQKFGISAHNTEVQFSYGLKKARQRLMGNRPDRGSKGSRGWES